jgi:hypothetical protein
MRKQFKWVLVSLLLLGTCLFVFARFSTLRSDLQMHKYMEQNRNQIRRTLPPTLPPYEHQQPPPSCYTDDCRARQIITI